MESSPAVLDYNTFWKNVRVTAPPDFFASSKSSSSGTLNCKLELLKKETDGIHSDADGITPGGSENLACNWGMKYLI